MSLEQLQTDFIQAMYDSVKAESIHSAQSQQRMSSQHKLTAEQQVDVYRASVQGGLIAALGDIYPRVKIMLGERFFDALAQSFVREHASTSPSLDDYGVQFPQYCAHFHALSDYPYLTDVACIDWGWHRAFHSKDVEALSGAALATLSQTQLLESMFNPHPSVSFCRSEYPVHHLWCLAEEQSDEQFDLDQHGAENVLVWRQGYKVKVEAIDLVTACLLEQFQHGYSVEKSFTLASNAIKNLEVETDLSEAFAFLINQGLLVNA